MNAERIEIQEILEQELFIAFKQTPRQEQLYAIRPVYSTYRDELPSLGPALSFTRVSLLTGRGQGNSVASLQLLKKL
ncbi:hypothetical protein [Paenibacillus sp. HW567]|uniref:hypothetical protein n=1 Tax=Paenibacillus sp. HW567 TaxID=1034769 RepID=UPI000379E712|nr:hypothetical protein [Paenibacillus sp. HW567]